jgi:hypothetical protein
MRILNNATSRMALVELADDVPDAQRAALRAELEGISVDDDAVGQRARATIEELDAHTGSTK